ncbi:MAG: DUF1214 domain-containing protein [Verrucomicrobia bacterium]|nr:DUF1214 domain-containing protein [Verrucomicrobiota bacterium]
MKHQQIFHLLIATLTSAALLGSQPSYAQITDPLGGQPAPGAKPSTSDLDAQVAYQRAFEAVIWSMPAVAIYRLRMGAFDNLGISNNGILAFSHTCKPNSEFLTANADVPYVGAYTDLRKGPVVLEVPAKTEKSVLYGQIVDAWQASIVDVGPSGADKGVGAKILLLPPGYTKPIPDGYIPVQSSGYRIAFAFRSVKLAGATNEDAYNYARKLRMYYLSEAENPPEQTFVDPSEMRYPSLPFYDSRYFQDVYDIVSVEPVQTRDLVMMGMLASIGIEPGEPYGPTPAVKAAMDKAVVDAWFYLQQQAYDRAQNNLFWPDRHWSSLIIPGPDHGFGFVTDTALLVEARGVQFFLGTYYPRIYDEQHAANIYLAPIADKDGAPLKAGKTYRMRVPADVPAAQFWSVTVYDQATWAFIYSPQMRPSISSFDKSQLKMNRDGSVDLYVGPKAPEALESNWLPTQGKRPYPTMRFYGAKPTLWDKSFVMPDVELMD